MKFGELLRDILQSSDIKMYLLAEHLGYDKSYISKWLNGVKLPLSRNLDETIASIAQFVSKNSNERQKQLISLRYDFDKSGREEPGGRDFADCLAEALREAYWQSKMPALELQSTSGYAAAEAGTHRSGDIIRLLRSCKVEAAGESLDCVLSLKSYTSDYALEIFNKLQGWSSEDRLLKLYLLIDVERAIENVDSCCGYICNLLSLSGNIKIFLLESPEEEKLREEDDFFLAVDHFVQVQASIPFAAESFGVIVEAEAVVRRCSEVAKKYIRSLEPMMYSNLTAWDREYFKYAISSNRQYLLTKMFPIHMKKELLERTLRNGERSEDGMVFYKREFETTASVIILESAIIEYVQTGALSGIYKGGNYEMSRADRKEHIMDIISELENNGRISMKILKDRNPYIPCAKTSPSLFFSDTAGYYLRGSDWQFFASSNCKTLFKAFLSNIQTSDGTYVYDRESTLRQLREALKLM